MDNVNKLLIQEKKSVSEKFHRKTENKKLGHFDFSDFPESWVKIHFKTYPRLDKIKLEKFKETNISNILGRRRSTRNFTDKPINLKDLSYILSTTGGINFFTKDGDYDSSKRNYPSAGARYPLEIYPLILNCEGIKRGLYHYNIKNNVLEVLLKKDLRKWLMKALGEEMWTIKSSVIFIITTVLDRTKIKYGHRGYKYSLLEAGHVAQNICLLSTELKLGSCAIGGFIDSEFDSLLDICFQKEFTLYLVAVGKI